MSHTPDNRFALPNFRQETDFCCTRDGKAPPKFKYSFPLTSNSTPLKSAAIAPASHPFTHENIKFDAKRLPNA